MKNREYHAHTFDPDIYKKFKKKCKQVDIPPSRMIGQLIRQYLEFDIASVITPQWAKEIKERLNGEKKT